MQDFHTRYQQWLNELAAAISQAKQQQVTQLFNLSETLKAYWKAGNDLTAYETSLFIETFRRQSDEQTMPSLWPETLWYELAQVTDKTQLEWQDLQSDFVHNGVYLAGEEVGMGMYCCYDCGGSVVFYHPAMLGECAACGAIRFRRQGLPV
ncbi:hypothetical protein EOE67_10675 [Rheinheimera riviphila]|uniref:Zinc ribbon-containing protein n=1 Tax=Rheinheimera riviphila TaxID=1834037 RepID=A0A437QS58_9GAMM|nr:hypothetical protein [Rheinheimera riviphila]RVU37341.1 hypothetical protein EOE67_10675 [Rheinheimera riviphila]